MTLLIAVVAGLLVGVTLGALGGGGAIITVPILIYAVGMAPHAATTASLVIVGISSLIASISHARAGRSQIAEGIVFGVLGTLGTYLGSRVSNGVDERVLLISFAVLLLVVAIIMFRGTTSRNQEGDASRMVAFRDILGFRPSFHCDWKRLGLLLLTATGVGLLTGFFGVGGGFAIVPALTLVLGFPMRVAVGTSLLVIGINSATALAARLSNGALLDWVVVATFTAMAIGGSLFGSKLTEQVSPVVLKRAFATLLVAVSIYTLVRTGLNLQG